MNKRLLKVALTTALTVAFAVPAFANPFSDVPAKHWAYDAVNKLAQAGIVDGYGDGTFKGEKTMTRYEMAQIVAKAMNKDLNSDQKATVDQLSKEFATELNNLGVKVEGLQKQVDNMVKISGDARVRYGANDVDGVTTDNTDFRARVSFDGKISDNLKFNARLTSGNIGYDKEDSTAGFKLDTANVSFKALGLDNTIGRQDVKLGNGFLIDTQLNALATKSGNLKLAYGNKADDRLFAGEYTTNVLGAKVVADYLKVENGAELYGANASFGLADNVTGNVEYFANDNDAKAVAYGVKFNKLGLSATYKDVEAGMVTKYSTLTSDITKLNEGDAFKGMEYQYDKALDKNTVLTVKHQNFEVNGADSARTSAYVNVKF